MAQEEKLTPRSADQQLSSEDKKAWQDPKLTFVEPKLTHHGELKEVTGFFGPFTP